MAPVDCDNLNCLYGSDSRETTVDDTDDEGAQASSSKRRDSAGEADAREREDRNRAPDSRPQTKGQNGKREPDNPEEKDQSDGKGKGSRNRRDESDGRSYEKPEKEEKSEFQKQVREATGRDLEIYGRKLFSKVPSTFTAVEQSPVPNGYVIGPGDRLQIRAWGQIDLAARVVVDRGGEIYLPKVGTINVAGVRFDQVEEYLKNAIGRLFRNFDLSVNLGKLHAIQIFVTGAARRPGSYTVGSFSTLVSVIFASGGPGPEGSMRHIQLKRRGSVVAQFDLYDLLLGGDTSKDVGLFSGDVVYIPPVGSQVAVSGSVKAPAIYETLGPTSVKQLIEIAGGRNPGVAAVIQRETITPEGKRARLSVSFDDPTPSLANGDILLIAAGSGAPEHAVVLRGNVMNPGRYPWHEGMRVSELIPSKEALIDRKYWFFYKKLGGEKADWYHEPKFQDKDKNDLSGKRQSIDPDEDEPQATTTVTRLLNDINWDYATIQRFNPEDLTTKLVDFKLGLALAKRGTVDDPVLQEHDVVTVFSQRDLRLPSEKSTRLVRIEGEVNAPGIYPIGPGETLRDLVAHAGGLTPLAYLFASDFRREATRKEQQRRLQQMIEEMDKQLRSRAAALSKASAEEHAAEQEQLVAERSVMEKLRETRATGRIVLELKPSDHEVAALPGLRLENEDRFFIPALPATVEVIGAVYNQNSFIYKTGKTVAQYLIQSGGGNRDADRARLFVVRADGSVVSKQMHHGLWAGSFESMRLMPGDTVIMPERIRTGGLLKGIRDWSQVFSQFALGAAAIRVISP